MGAGAGGSGARAVALRGVTLAGVTIVLAVGTRRIVAALESAVVTARRSAIAVRHRGRQIEALDAVGRLLDLDGLYDEHPDTLIPDSLLASARLAEAGTPYWLIAKAKRFTLKGKQVLDLGVIEVLVRGLDASSR